MLNIHTIFQLCFRKNDVITITQQPEGGWWEGTLGEKTGWFPSNYVLPIEDQQGYFLYKFKSVTGILTN